MKGSSDRSVPKSTLVKSQAAELGNQYTGSRVHGHVTQICAQHCNRR